jgi:uncharacterized protein
MRVVLDTSVLVSAALKQKSMPGMAALLVQRRGGLLKSLATEQQLFEAVARPYFDALIGPDTPAWLEKLMAAAEPVTITEPIVACRDPTDDKFLELAVNGHAGLIVSGTAIYWRSIHFARSRSSHRQCLCKVSLASNRREAGTTILETVKAVSASRLKPIILLQAWLLTFRSCLASSSKPTLPRIIG